MKHPTLRWAQLCVAATISAVFAFEAEASPKKIIVGRGDTVATLAKEHGVSRREIARVNGISVDAELRKGTRLIIPDPDESSGKPSTMRRAAKLVADRVSLRKGPDEEQERITLLEEGERLIATRRAGDWVKVKTSSGDSGWIRSDFLKISESNLPEPKRVEKTAAATAPPKKVAAKVPPSKKVDPAPKHAPPVNSAVVAKSEPHKKPERSAKSTPTKKDETSSQHIVSLPPRDAEPAAQAVPVRELDWFESSASNKVSVRVVKSDTPRPQPRWILPRNAPPARVTHSRAMTVYPKNVVSGGIREEIIKQHGTAVYETRVNEPTEPDPVQTPAVAKPNSTPAPDRSSSRTERLARRSVINSAVRPAIIRTAFSYRGVPYRFGGTTRRGIDCSAFTGTIFRAHGVSLPRTAREQFARGQKVAFEDMRPGDLVFFHTTRSGISHVGMYIGSGKFVHASSKGGVKTDSIMDGYYRRRFRGARRVKEFALN